MIHTRNSYTAPDELESWKKAGKLENAGGYEKLHFPDPALPQKAGNGVASWNRGKLELPLWLCPP